jgi:hypothetical protein
MFLSARATQFNRALIYANSVPLRRMKLHEYQAGAVLHSYKVPIPIGHVAFSADEAKKLA